MSEEFLSVAAYSKAEHAGRDHLPNRAIQASSKETFSRVGFPDSCSGDGGIWRFAETMHEGSHSWVWKKFLTGLTENEAAALSELNFDILPKLSSRYHRSVQAGNSFLSPLLLARQVNAMFPGKRLRILEIGSGSGYLSWYLARAGHTVITTDVAQGFYLFQNHLLRQGLGDAMVELATDDSSIADCLNDPEIRSIHLPWWKYYDLYRSEPSWFVDVILSEGNLCEMSAYGHRYAINLADRVLDRENAFSFLGFLTWGYQEYTRHFDVFEAFCESGFAMRHTDEKLTVMAPCNEPQGIGQDLRKIVEHYRQSTDNWRNVRMLPDEFTSPTPEWTQFVHSARTRAEAEITISEEEIMKNDGAKFGLSLPGGEDQSFSRFLGVGQFRKRV